MTSTIDAAAGAVRIPPLQFPSAYRGLRRARLARLIAVTDLVAIVAGAGCGFTAESGQSTWYRFLDGQAWVPLVLVLTWSAALVSHRTRATHIIGAGKEEYRRLTVATLQVFGIGAMIAGVCRFHGVFPYLAVALPVGLGALILSRWVWRGLLDNGRGVASVLVVGNPASARALARAISRPGGDGYVVVGAVLPDDAAVALDLGECTVPVFGGPRAIIGAARRTGADFVAVAGWDGLDPHELRRLAWDLEPLGAELIVAPGLAEVARIRLSSRTVAGVPVLHIGKPRYDLAASRLKRLFDVAFALTAVLLTAPLMAVVAVAVKATSAGPVLYRAERIGLDGKPFRMTKFRSMSTDADRHAEALIAAEGAGAGFFKLKEDPRVTGVGRVLRKYSLDELPQFIDVLRGDMSVVGPRPQVWREVSGYTTATRRRLLVKPGITGLWQVSGRSDLAPEQSYDLDLSYVENWSMLLDLRILARTFGVVTGGDGAY